MPRAKGFYHDGRYFTTLDKEERIDFYERQVAFWKSVVAKYPRPQNRTQHNYMIKCLDEEIMKQ